LWGGNWRGLVRKRGEDARLSSSIPKLKKEKDNTRKKRRRCEKGFSQSIPLSREGGVEKEEPCTKG